MIPKNAIEIGTIYTETKTFSNPLTQIQTKREPYPNRNSIKTLN